MAQPRYHVSQINQLTQQFAKEEPASVFYLAQTYNLGICIGELVGMGINADELRQAIETIIQTAIKSRTPSPIAGLKQPLG